MKLYTIETGHFKLDGGAMFGVVPKSIWHKLNPADENNMISLAMRSLLIEDGNRLILIDNGMGQKQDDKFFGYYYLHGNHSLDKSLSQYGFSKSDITDMVLTHLHFDHCGGSIEWNNDRTKYQTAFPNATYWVAEEHWKEAMAPNPREKASFLKENILPIKESGQLALLKEDDNISDTVQLGVTHGHTQSMIHPIILYKDYTIIYMADLIPTQAHIPTAYVMGYDVRPLVTMQEKEDTLKEAILTENTILFFEHDPLHEACTVHQTEKGVRVKEQVLIKDL
ncbi:MAG: MBL fold metallo-hydrolase [Bacteroidia bacterium]|jgi:glyoxylase-like metal-dependent hydrolase (beta-lactamase superfamily II)|nr:MBL fold metallo-hydrolase [Bacteroidia bacterium]